ncbi:FG-GAP repeat domain-containing protein [Actinacidiphila acididurans]|uniref:VCBS repeat-containing protein n=1 Tax=Actinacidiphila acididurans TaxID=2784346 RepID=A0ABS2TT92_9ACTN|nr:VCBS repeat-containing protein [Actinacidiphila acididurans]MBM9506548.1 VCBS repeat-containing protein [Actinacidiphila acididurans]
MRRRRTLLIGSGMMMALAAGLPGVPAMAAGPADDMPSVTVPPATVAGTGAPAWQNGGLALDQGRLFVGTDVYDSYDGTENWVSAADVSLGADGTPAVGTFERSELLDYGNPDDGLVKCTAACRRLTATGWADDMNGMAAQGYASHDTDVSVVAAAGGYTVVRRGTPQRQYVLDARYSHAYPRQLRQSAPTAAALWENTLWTAGTGAQQGTVTATELPAMKPGRTVSVGADCAITDLQAVSHWIYWSCGPDGSAGVYDLAAGRLLPVESGYGMLADGYLVTQDAAGTKLRIGYLPQGAGGTVDTQDLADLPSRPGVAADQRGLYWTVDRFGGGTALIDADSGIRVLMPRATTSNLTMVPATVDTVTDQRGSAPYWWPDWSMSKPVSSWTLQVRSAATGRVVWTTSGGPTRGHLPADARYDYPNWIGRDASGALVPTGTYLWTFSATAADRPGDTAALTGQVSVKAVERHDYGRDGIGDLIRVTPSGAATVLTGNGSGGFVLSGKHSVAGWSSGYLAVPFGDIGGYRCNDTLVRLPSGELRIWQGDCGGGIPSYPPNIRSYSLGMGWNQYTALVAAGDQTGDNRVDLLAEDHKGDLWLYAQDGKGGFEPRRRVGWSLSGYTKLVGAGDLDGDGIGDLLATDRSGNLWRWSGTAGGGWHTRVKIGTGFATVTSLVGVGDITGDGRADLVGLDRNGYLWRWSGNGKGGLATMVKIATGWKGYQLY